MAGDVVLGIDPGLNNTGWGVVRILENSLSSLGAGIIHNSKTSNVGQKLFRIYSAVDELIKKYRPNSISLEITFVNSNPMSALNLGYSRGIVLTLAAQHDTPLFEYSPASVKKAVTGSGRADKEQVKYMTERLLKLDLHDIKHDTSDALAIALCHIFSCAKIAA